MTRAKKIAASIYVLAVLTLGVHEASKPQDVKNINDGMIYNYFITETSDNIDYTIEYLSSRDGCTTATPIDIDLYFSANSHLLIKASENRQNDIDDEVLNTLTAEVKQAEAEDALLRALAEEVRQAELAKQKAEEEKRKAEAKEKRDAAKQSLINSQIQNFNFESVFYIENIDTSKGILRMDYDHQAYLYKTCSELGVDYLTAFAMIITESSCNNNVPYNGYYGYFQMNDGCVRSVRAYYNDQQLDPTNPYDNILIGVTILKDMQDQTGSLYDGVMAYNKGYYGWLNNPDDTRYVDTVMKYREELVNQL